MALTRRRAIERLGGGASALLLAAPGISTARRRRISQPELADAIERHARWLDDRSSGRRAVFSECDLTGLAFAGAAGLTVNLRGSDFTDADMTGVTGDDVSFLWSSLQNARLSWSRLACVTFSHADLRGAECDNVTWGWDRMSEAHPCRAAPETASGLQSTHAGTANFVGAKIRGFFHDTSFVGSDLTNADLSYSEFCGTGFSENTFFRANLTNAKFRCAKMSHTRMSQAICNNVDFTDMEIGYRVTLP